MEIKKPGFANSMGLITIEEEVISTLAGTSAVKVDGVASMIGGWGTDLTERLGMRNFKKGIKIGVIDDEIQLELYIEAVYGYRIVDLAENVQKEVKTALETMAGLKVKAVNVNVLGVLMKKIPTTELEEA